MLLFMNDNCDKCWQKLLKVKKEVEKLLKVCLFGNNWVIIIMHLSIGEMNDMPLFDVFNQEVDF